MGDRLTLASFTEQFQVLERIVESRDPARRDFGLRLTAAFVMFHHYDRLRSADRPFDRRCYMDVLAALTDLLSAWPATIRPPMLPQDDSSDVQDFIGKMYSSLWLDYDEEQYLNSVELFEKRLRWNDISPDVVKDKICLDAGCGGGRYTVALAQLGARIAVGVDFGWNGLLDALSRARRYAGSARFVQGSALELPFANGRFDFIVCNGVLHHTIDPEGGLRELARVLRPGGAAYLMVYGAEGLHWILVDFIGRIVSSVPVEHARVWLNLIGLPVNKVFHYVDHWFVPVCERTTQEEFEKRLVQAGFTDLKWVTKGPPYDLAYRSLLFPEDRDLFGIGILRYLARRASG